MTPERWRRIEELFEQVVELPTVERGPFLTSVCHGDTEIQREVESLLQHEQADGEYLDEAVRSAAREICDEGEAWIGRSVGPYLVAGIIGRGGMGVVYLATREDEFCQNVAIKLVKRGMDTDFLLSRFRYERQILASLDHPYIARLLDGGSTGEGLPYFVMEYVEGLPITTYCERNHLDINSRIRLFRLICSAVSYAHRSLIVHRDLKPGNILVTAEGVPKLLDFGVAKLLAPEYLGESPTVGVATAATIRMMTPEYASPEQVRGERVTTATDVYSLGAILFELLTGRRPHEFKSRSPEDIARAVCEESPAKPSAATTTSADVRRQLQGDLDNIVLMAMRKEPDRRYSSVEQFSEDLGRYLEGRPVLARNDTFTYRVAKFVRRNRLSLTAAVLVMIAITGGVASTLYQAQRAERRFEQVRRLAHTMLFDFHDRVRNLPGSTEAREILVKTSLDYLRTLEPDSGGDATLRRELANAYRKVADVQGYALASNLGDTAGALHSYGHSIAIFQKLIAISPPDKSLNVELGETYMHFGDTLRAAGGSAESRKQYQLGIDLAEQTVARNPDYTPALELLGSLYDTMGRAGTETGDLDQARRFAARSVEIAERLAAQDKSPTRRDALANSYSTYGVVLSRMGLASEALRQYRKSVAIREELASANLSATSIRRNLMLIYSHIGDLYTSGSMRPAKAGEEEALAAYSKVLAIAESLVAVDPSDRKARLDLAFSLLRVGRTRLLRDTRGALPVLRRSLSIVDDLLQADTRNYNLRINQSYLQEKIGLALVDQGNVSGGLIYLRQALANIEEACRRDPKQMPWKMQLIAQLRSLVEVLGRAGKEREALDAASRLLAETRQIPETTSISSVVQKPLAYAAVGRMYENLAASGPLSRRPVHLLGARENYQKSVDSWSALARSGRLGELYSEEPKELAQRLAGLP